MWRVIEDEPIKLGRIKVPVWESQHFSIKNLQLSFSFLSIYFMEVCMCMHGCGFFFFLFSYVIEVR